MSDQQMCSKQKAGAWSLKLKSIDRNDKISPHGRRWKPSCSSGGRLWNQYNSKPIYKFIICKPCHSIKHCGSLNLKDRPLIPISSSIYFQCLWWQHCIFISKYFSKNEKSFFILKLKTIHKWFLCPYKRQISMLRFIALRGVWPHRNVALLKHR